MDDLKYQNEDNIKKLDIQTDEINELQKQLEAKNLVVEARDNHILDLKESIVQSEIKNRRLLEQLNSQISQSA